MQLVRSGLISGVVFGALAISHTAAASSYAGFADPGFFLIQHRSNIIEAGDMDGDGSIDLVTESGVPTMIEINFGLGDGAFGNTQTIATQNAPRHIKLADVNLDGALDLLYTGFSSFQPDVLYVALNSGDGVYELVTPFLIPGSISDVAVGDLNGDAAPDLVFAKQSAFSDATVLLGVGDGTFTIAPSIALGKEQWRVEIGDLNQDGVSDLVFGLGNDEAISVLSGVGDGTFVETHMMPVHGFVYDMELSDLNSDGALDIVAAISGRLGITRFLGVGDGTFGAPELFPTPDVPERLSIAQFDNDPAPDLAVLNDARDLYVLRGDGSGGFFLSDEFALAHPTGSLTATNLDGDGYDDIAVVTGSIPSYPVLVFLNQTDADPPGAFSLLSPPNGQNNVPVRTSANAAWVDVVLSWSTAAPDFSEVTYELEIAADEQFTQVIYQIEGLTSIEHVIPPNITIEAQSYFWRVTARNRAGETVSSPEAFTFTTGVCSSNPWDVNDDGAVDGVDLAMLLANWTPKTE